MTLSVGHPIAAFSGPATGGTFDSAAQAGKKLVVYCTTQSEAFRDAHAEFRKAGAEILGVSRDSLKSHENFKAKLVLPFELLSDSDESLCTQFGVIKMKNMYGKQVRGIERSTFVIGKDGALLREWRGVKVPGHVAEVLAFVQSA
ncbi:MAG: peroxiredoxin [Burkholderiales bacterium]|nr:peroxiredoxin [Burkholderiales bacterium]